MGYLGRYLLAGCVGLLVAASASGEPGGEGPYDRLVLRGATLIDGTGAPPYGPVDIVIEEGRIERIVIVGVPGLAINPDRRPPTGEGGHELDLAGMYVLPGFIDTFAGLGGPEEYLGKLWLGHGVTTVREPLCLEGIEACLERAAKSARREVTAPRIVPWLHFRIGHSGPYRTSEEARQWVAAAAKAGAHGIKFRGYRKEIFTAALEEAEARGLPTSAHHSPLHVARSGVLDTTALGLDIVEHWYGLPEALFTDRTVPDYPTGYHYDDEQQRFAQAGRLWQQAAPRGSPRWTRVIDNLVTRGVTLVPTLSLYEANRDLMRARRAEWHDDYTLPSLWRSFQPSRKSHASQWFDWTTKDETAWRGGYRRWMDFLRDYKDRGGRVAAGTDSGFMYSLHGFAFVRELELLHEAGFHPLEVVRAATLAGAEALGIDADHGSVEVGKVADLVVVGEDPLANFKVLYGTGTIRLDRDDVPRRVGGVLYALKDGVVFDARELLADVRGMVAAAKAEEE